MSPKKPGHKTQLKSVRLTTEEAELLRQISKAELISEAALMRKFGLEGSRRYRIIPAPWGFSAPCRAQICYNT
jgi:hypothetical protein